jgi:hypothetical protein
LVFKMADKVSSLSKVLERVTRSVLRSK